jgi:hypothetical protein
VDHDGSTDCDGSSDEDEEDLEADPQTQPKSAHGLLSKLIAQMRNAQGVLVFGVFPLHFKELGLLLQKRRCVPCDFGIAARQLGGYCRGERLGTGQRVRRFSFRLFVILPQDPAEQALSHDGTPYLPPIIVDTTGASQVNNVLGRRQLRELQASGQITERVCQEF